jgi:hypothetical protein
MIMRSTISHDQQMLNSAPNPEDVESITKMRPTVLMNVKSTLGNSAKARMLEIGTSAPDGVVVFDLVLMLLVVHSRDVVGCTVDTHVNTNTNKNGKGVSVVHPTCLY